MRRFHAVATLVWLALIPPSVTWWRDSVPYLVVLSVWANVAGHWSSYQAARAEQEDALTDHDLDRIAERLSQ